MRKCIAVGIPTLGTVSMRWCVGYAQLVTPMNSRSPRFIEEGLEVGLARNAIAAKALADASQPTHLMFLDDDVLFHPTVLVQLLSHNLPIVAGVYYSKGDRGEPLIFDRPGCGTLPYTPGGGLLECWGHGMGLCLIRTDLLARVRDELDLPRDARGNPEWFRTVGDSPDDGGQWTEDLWFCSLLDRLDIARHVDQDPRAFGWHYDAGSKVGYPRPQWDQFIATGAAEWTAPAPVGA